MRVLLCCQAASVLLFKPLILHVDRKSTRLNSSHSQISYAVFCLKKTQLSDLSSLLSDTRIAAMRYDLTTCISKSLRPSQLIEVLDILPYETTVELHVYTEIRPSI